MKKVIFFCLLTFAVGFSQTATGNVPSPVATQPDPKTVTTGTGSNPPVPAAANPGQQTGATGQQTGATGQQTGTTVQQTAATSQQTGTPGSQTGTPVQPQQPDANDKKTNSAVPPSLPPVTGNGTTTNSSTDGSKPATEPVPAVPASGNQPQTNSSQVPAVTEKDAKTKVTDKPGNPTQAPAANTTKPVAVSSTEKPPVNIEQGRSFDGASFIGGIILTLGLLAMGFIGFKYYKARVDRNYHTL